jgi:hypothetical protein
MLIYHRTSDGLDVYLIVRLGYFSIVVEFEERHNRKAAPRSHGVNKPSVKQTFS